MNLFVFGIGYTAGHYLRQQGPQGIESVAIYPNRLPSNRGNTYLPPLFSTQRDAAEYEIFPNWDCENAGGEKKFVAGNPAQSSPACLVSKPNFFQGRTQGKFAHVNANDYSK